MKIAFFLDELDQFYSLSLTQLLNALHEADHIILASGEKDEQKGNIFRIKAARIRKFPQLNISPTALSKVTKILKTQNVTHIYSFSITGMGLLAKEAAKKLSLPAYFSFLKLPQSIINFTLWEKIVENYLDWFLEPFQVIHLSTHSKKITKLEGEVLNFPVKKITFSRTRFNRGILALPKRSTKILLANLHAIKNLYSSIKVYILGNSEYLKYEIFRGKINDSAFFISSIAEGAKKASFFFYASSSDGFLPIAAMLSSEFVPIVYQNTWLAEFLPKELIFYDPKDIPHKIQELAENPAKYLRQYYNISPKISAKRLIEILDK